MIAHPEAENSRGPRPKMRAARRLVTGLATVTGACLLLATTPCEGASKALASPAETHIGTGWVTAMCFSYPGGMPGPMPQLSRSDATTIHGARTMIDAEVQTRNAIAKARAQAAVIEAKSQFSKAAAAALRGSPAAIAMTAAALAGLERAFAERRAVGQEPKE